MVGDLQRELTRYGAAGCVLLLIITSAFAVLEAGMFAVRFILLSTACWLYVCWQCWQLLVLNTPDHDTALHPTLGGANCLTLLRAFLIACTAGFLFNDFSHQQLGYVPALLYTIAAMLDRVDGYIARRTQRTTLLGRELDTIIDALGLVVAPMLAVLLGKAHISYLLVSAAWYLFSWGLYWRRQHHKPAYSLLPSQLRRTMAGFQMGFVAGALWPPLDASMTQLFGMAFMLPLLVGFCVDWLVVSGRINTRTTNAVERFLLLGTFTQTYAMPLLRLALIGLLLRAIYDRKIVAPLFQGFSVEPAATGAISSPAWALSLASGILLASAAGILAGFLGRLCATIVMLLLCWFFPFTTVDGHAALTIASIVLIILLGTGHYSVRRADENWINRHDGA